MSLTFISHSVDELLLLKNVNGSINFRGVEMAHFHLKYMYFISFAFTKWQVPFQLNLGNAEKILLGLEICEKC